MEHNIYSSLFGVTLPSPVIVGSGPLTDSLGRIKKFFSCGAGAVIGKTIFSGQHNNVKEKIHVDKVGLFNSTTYSKKSTEAWMEILNALNQLNHIVIPSIHADSPDALGVLASKIAAANCRIVELGIACPNDGSQQKITPDLIYAYTAKVKEYSSVDIIVKLAAVDNYLDCSEAAIAGGAGAISMSDTIPAVVFDSNKRHYIFENPAGYSGPSIKPIILHAIYQMRKRGIKCPIIGIGGIQSAQDVLEYLHVGANAVQIYTALMFRPKKLIQKINDDLLDWCVRHNTTLKDIYGVLEKNVTEMCYE